ncbi:MAG: hypothetical protein ACK5IJ_01625 [Mangrovibacterium sp.]
MEILFRTKEEANKAQQEYFLSLSPAERFCYFLEMSRKSQGLFPNKKKENNNFVLRKPVKDDK